MILLNLLITKYYLPNTPNNIVMTSQEFLPGTLVRIPIWIGPLEMYLCFTEKVLQVRHG